MLFSTTLDSYTSKTQKRRLESIFDDLEETPIGQTCKGMKGLIRETDDFISESTSLFGSDAPPEVLDAGLITSIQRIEHYEIAGYGTLRTYAEHLERTNDLGRLKESLEEEKEADETLTRLAVESVNLEAAYA